MKLFRKLTMLLRRLRATWAAKRLTRRTVIVVLIIRVNSQPRRALVKRFRSPIAASDAARYGQLMLL